MPSTAPGENADESLRVVRAVALKVSGSDLSPEALTGHASALRQLAGLPQDRLTSSARRTLSKRGELDPLWWLKLATENTPASTRAPATLADVERILDRLMGTERRVEFPLRGRRSTSAPRPTACAAGALCTGCGAVMGLGSVCGCRATENAGRCNN
jgi:hypothetical protein